MKYRTSIGLGVISTPYLYFVGDVSPADPPPAVV